MTCMSCKEYVSFESTSRSGNHPDVFTISAHSVVPSLVSDVEIDCLAITVGVMLTYSPDHPSQQRGTDVCKMNDRAERPSSEDRRTSKRWLVRCPALKLAMSFWPLVFVTRLPCSKTPAVKLLAIILGLRSLLSNKKLSKISSYCAVALLGET